MANILVITEHHEGALAPSTLATVSAAQATGLGAVHMLVAGDAAAKPAADAAAQVAGVEKVLWAESADLKWPLAEVMAPLIKELAGGYDAVFAPASTFGKDVLPRAAALLDVPQVSDIIEVLGSNQYKRPIYAGNAITTVENPVTPQLVTVRPSAFNRAEASGGSASIENVDVPANTGLSNFVNLEATQSDRPDLTAASVVVSGGRALGSADNFKLIEDLADALGGAVGASRAAVDAGYISNDYQVGQTGKAVAPDLYIAVGISGAIQHLAGMTNSKVIVAINTDENAPIFDVADYGLVADLFDAVPQLTEAVKS